MDFENRQKYIESIPWIMSLIKLRMDMEDESEITDKDREDYAFLSDLLQKAENFIGKSHKDFTIEDRIKVFDEFCIE